MREPSADWKKLMAVSAQLAEQGDTTGAIVIDTIEPGAPYEKIVSRQQAWLNKYQRCAARGLIRHPMRIRRNRLDGGGYEIEAVLDLQPAIEHALVEWVGPDDESQD